MYVSRRTRTPEPKQIPARTAADLNQKIAGCKPFTLAWKPTTAGTVSIEIITGASQGTLVSAGTVASGIANTGIFVWTPSAALGANAVTGYKIIVDATKEFQYSVPFSVSPCASEETTSTPPAVSTPTYGPTSSSSSVPEYSTSAPVSEVPTYVPSSSCVSTSTSTVYVNPPVGTGYPVAPAPPAGTGYPVAPAPPAGTGYPVAPAPPAGTGYPMVPGVPSAPVAPYPVNPPTTGTTVYPTASGTGSGVYPTAPPGEFTGAASAVKAGLSFAVAAAAFAFML
jgi:hypothetical protein